MHREIWRDATWPRHMFGAVTKSDCAPKFQCKIWEEDVAYMIISGIYWLSKKNGNNYRQTTYNRHMYRTQSVNSHCTCIYMSSVLRYVRFYLIYSELSIVLNLRTFLFSAILSLRSNETFHWMNVKFDYFASFHLIFPPFWNYLFMYL